HCLLTDLSIPCRCAFFPCSPSIRANRLSQQRCCHCAGEHLAVEPATRPERSGLTESQATKATFSLWLCTAYMLMCLPCFNLLLTARGGSSFVTAPRTGQQW